jgi:hypothetical protein
MQMKRFKGIGLLAVWVVLGVSCGEKEPKPVVPATPAAPSNIKLHGATENTLVFQWDPVENAASYAWTLSPVSNPSTPVQSGTTRNRNVTVSGLTDGTEYRFGVRSVGTAVEGSATVPMSDFTYLQASTVKKEEPPTPPTPPAPAGIPYEDYMIPAAEEGGPARAFPGAEGCGMFTTGGRGGAVYHVTTLEDNSSKGSLRYALSQSGARTIVFDVAGIIELKSALTISKGDVTIAGQTAPGDGICISNYTVQNNADNVVMRFVRFRLGDGVAGQEDCIWGRNHAYIILDHCSMSWSIDECASFYANENFTLQWCILTESMNNSAHSKGAHGYGGIWGGKNASFHHNLLSNHHSRNPRIDHPEIYPKSGDTFDWSKRGNVDLRNLVVYNWGDNSSYGGEGGKFNFVNCWYKPGPDSKDRHYFVDAYKNYTRGDKTVVDYGYPLLYMSGNVNTKYEDITGNNAAGIYWHNGGTGTLQGTAHTITGPSGQAAYTTTHTAEAGKDAVLAFAGDRLHRDAVDIRATDGVKNNTGKIIDTPVDVGGWPEYTASAEQLAKLADADKDGMPDWFEDQFGLKKGDASDAAVVWLDKNGRYSNLEMYLHYLVKDIVSGGNAGGVYTKL